ncbi:hypothetical protein LAG73_01955 [Pseudoxanthomonas japonensis]|nr:hypothetical protein LAG73_01955 [Pseudoxanthomonas japonensis]
MTRTNAYTLLCVAIRAVVVWFSASLLLMIPGLMIAMRDGTYQGDAIWLGLAAILLPVLVPGLAWLFADKLARLALARPQEPAFESRIRAPLALWPTGSGEVRSGLNRHSVVTPCL